LPTSVIIAGSKELAAGFQQPCGTLEDIHVYKILHQYPSDYELARTLSVFDPQIVFLDLTAERGLEVGAKIAALHHDTIIVGFAAAWDGRFSTRASEIGVRTVLLPPFERDILGMTVIGVMEAQRSSGTPSVFGFIPGKAGTGCTTVALHVALTLASECTHKVLVVEADLYSGIMRSLLNLQLDYSIVHALQDRRWLNEGQWEKLIATYEGLHLLTGTGGVAEQFSPLAWLGLLSFGRMRYDSIVVDLPELLNEGTQALAAKCKGVHVICTPERVSILMTRKRIAGLEEGGVPASRVHVVLNRNKSTKVTVEEVEHLLDRQLSAVLPNDFLALTKASAQATLLAPGAALRTACTSFAKKLAGVGQSTAPSRFSFFKRAANHA